MNSLLKILLQNNLITKISIAQYLKINKNKKVTLKGLIEEKLVDDDKIWDFFANQLKTGQLSIADLDGDESINLEKIYAKISGIQFIDLDSVEIDTRLTAKTPLAQLKKSRAIPIVEKELKMLVAFADPFDIGSQEAVQRIFPKKPLSILAASNKQIQEYLNKLEITQSKKSFIPLCS